MINSFPDEGEENILQTYVDASDDSELTKSEKLRTHALALAISYYREVIIKDGKLLKAMLQVNSPVEQPSDDSVLETARKFAHFIEFGLKEKPLQTFQQPPVAQPTAS